MRGTEGDRHIRLQSGGRRAVGRPSRLQGGLPLRDYGRPTKPRPRNSRGGFLLARPSPTALGVSHAPGVAARMFRASGSPTSADGVPLAHEAPIGKTTGWTVATLRRPSPSWPERPAAYLVRRR